MLWMLRDPPRCCTLVSQVGNASWATSSRSPHLLFHAGQQHSTEQRLPELLARSLPTPSPHCRCWLRCCWCVSGTIPNKRLETFVCDLRCMVSSTTRGFQPLAVYARRALLPLKPTLASADDSWQMLGTNLSIKKADGTWTTDTSRLLLMDCKDFNRLGIGIDDLIEAYVQTVLATLAIDRMASRLTNGSADGQFDRQLYASLNNDHSLLGEIMQ